MDLSIALACIGAGISFYGVLQYINGILHRGTKPRMASWAAWLTANSIFTIIALQESAWLAAAINGAGVLANLLIIGMSIKKRVSMKPVDSIDWACLVVSVSCVILILVIPENKVAVAVLAMAANLIATAPTFRHAWSKPREETWQLFAANAIANGLGTAGVVLVSGAEFVAMAGPLVSTLGNLMLVTITLGRGWLMAVEKEIERDVQLIEEELAIVEPKID